MVDEFTLFAPKGVRRGTLWPRSAPHGTTRGLMCLRQRGGLLWGYSPRALVACAFPAYAILACALLAFALAAFTLLACALLACAPLGCPETCGIGISCEGLLDELLKAGFHRRQSA